LNEKLHNNILYIYAFHSFILSYIFYLREDRIPLHLSEDSCN